MKLNIIVILFSICLITACSGNQSTQEEAPPEVEEMTSNQPAGFYIGTYTNGISEGIYYATFDPGDGSMRDLKLAVEAGNPSFLTLSSNGSYLYSVNESLSESGESALMAYEVQSPGKLLPIDTTSSKGTYACYIATDNAGQFVLSANYGSGNVISAAISSGGGFLEKSWVKQHEGSGPNASRQEGPHAHSIILDPAERYALAADLGTDKIMIYAVGSDGALVENSPAFAEAAPGAGPRHIAFHPNGNVVYVINELNATITAYDYDAESGLMSERQTVNTLPEGFSGDNKCADIHVHPNGRLLFGSNRGHDSIVSFVIEDDGSLSLADFFTDGVKWPRNFAISPDGGYLLIANEQGNSIVSAKVDQETGMMEATGKRIEVGAPVCIEFE
ncbi:lactonase family protein [Fulvivirga sedimenti]|uniref:Lactonase family protein n=1 Tax=Fulvivirga sedimenti TaxID=2879465 RepID=A0A9X1L1J3_9BACT|nr:lactonase family protein [Fulvivirga sedimenti]MCA6078904.1 lactonase family protein [Fulvivirga sedimenti]